MLWLIVAAMVGGLLFVLLRKPQLKLGPPSFDRHRLDGETKPIPKPPGVDPFEPPR